MRDPQVLEVTIDTATHLTKLVAAYGIYAILILFMFYQQSRERKCLAEAKNPQQEAYYRRRSSVVLGVTILLAIFACITWFYATFRYKPKVVVEGQVGNLLEQKTMPSKIGDPPRITYQIDAYTSDGRFYSGKRGGESGASLTGDFEWALTSRRGVRTLHLIFKREFSAIKSDSQDFQIATLGPQPPLPKIERFITKHATIRFRDLQEAMDSQIRMEYQSNSDIREIGSLLLYTEEGTKPIPWVPEDGGSSVEAAPEEQSTFFGIGTAWAEGEQPRVVFGTQGEVSEAVYRSLKVFLESEDLGQQVKARETLVEGGARSFPTVERLLVEPASEPNSQNRLVHNVASAIEKLASSDTRIPPSLNLALARSLYNLGDYELAAQFFSRVPESQKLPLQESHQRALAYLNAGRYEKAQGEFVRLLGETEKSGQISIITTNLGTVYSRQGRWEDAITAYRKALSLDSKNITAIYNLGSVETKLGNYAEAEKIFRRGYEIDPSNPFILNGLAYAWAQQEKNLETALSYAEKALATNPENSEFLDTKGWVLYKRGQPRQAIEYLDKALRKRPGSEEIKSHVDTVRKEISNAAARQSRQGAS